jgi:predicted O-methyltransferase YrrM
LYEAEHSLAAVLGVDRKAVRETLEEIRQDAEFLEDLAAVYDCVLNRKLKPTDFMYLTRIDPQSPFRIKKDEAGGLLVHGPIQYALVRLLRPSVVVETGGTPGNSSAFILRALDRNKTGELHTIDLPPTGGLKANEEQGHWVHAGMPEGKTSGWAGEELRGRHRQYLGDARQLLPEVLDQVGQMDLFIHDSDHSYEHMIWEFQTAWPRLRAGGVLLSDDVNANAAWRDFMSAKAMRAFRAFSLGMVPKASQLP